MAAALFAHSQAGDDFFHILYLNCAILGTRYADSEKVLFALPFWQGIVSGLSSDKDTNENNVNNEFLIRT